MAFIKGLMILGNIEKFMAEESELLLDYCSHISILTFTSLRYERLTQSEEEISYQVYLYAFDENPIKENDFHLSLGIIFDLQDSNIEIRPQFGRYTAEENFGLGDLKFYQGFFRGRFFIDFDSDMEWDEDFLISNNF
ncbi:hypothetical protein C1I62_09230 [Streptococcus intermedius]|uniref:Uncharacterized protein n=1 Tax=Streptococcus intermedius TaxID=1338 RepID=A0A930WF05_STRIT|nr:hypothetical protein [Streptococcus intermedius]MBF1713224.1 hypothetical protein [Streptococcus intermedius]PMR65032.1 hypothetical protein C1I62_09230 [Streptococcus intermedius]